MCHLPVTPQCDFAIVAWRPDKLNSSLADGYI